MVSRKAHNLEIAGSTPAPATMKFRDLKIGDKFEVYGDTHINYDYPKICVCIKIDEWTAEEVDGIKFGINPSCDIFEFEK